MKHKNRFTAAALALLMTAALCGCGQNTGSTADLTENSTAQKESSGNSAAKDSLPDLVIGSELTVGIGPMTASPGQKSVPVSVKMWNNPGFSSGGFKLGFDPALTPIANGNVSMVSGIPEAQMDTGEAVAGFLTSCLIGEEAHIIAFGCMSMEPSTSDGVIFTCYFDIPEDAPIGTEYQFTCEIDSLNDEASQPLTAQTADGILRIE